MSDLQGSFRLGNRPTQRSSSIKTVPLLINLASGVLGVVLLIVILCMASAGPPSVPIMGETTASLVITVEGKEVVERWRKQGCWEWKRRWRAERKEGVARLEFRPPPPPPRGRGALPQATESRSRTRPSRRSPCDDGSPRSTSFAFSARPIAAPSPASSAPCCAARACTRRT